MSAVRELRAPTVEPLERPLPQNLDAERSVLGAILIDDHLLSVAVERLKPEHFFQNEHRLIFAQMIELGKNRLAIDLVTLSEQLQRKRQLEAAGGAAYVAQLMDGVPRVGHMEHYARIIREKSALRTLISAANAMKEVALDATEDVNAILDRAAIDIGKMRGEQAQKENGLKVYTASEFSALSPEPVEYIAYPLAARGMVTVIDGPAKAAGKTTLLLTAVRASSRGNLFLNHPTKCLPILYLTEENPRTFNVAVARAELTESATLHIVPLTSFAGTPWPQLVQQIEQLCVELKIGWLIVDTFYAIAGLGGEEENKAGAVDAAIAPLRAIAGRLDIAVTISRHERKSGGDVGVSGRGSSALTGAVDIVLLLKRLPGNQAFSPNRRQLDLTGRVEQATLTVELREDGTYIIVDTAAEDSSDEVETLDRAIQANPTSSNRQLETITGIGRNRIIKIAAKAGWTQGDSGWERTAS